MSKTVNFKNVRPVAADDWVTGGRPANRESPTRPATTTGPAPAVSEATKRFTIDVPVALHTRIKTECARRGVKMADVMRELLEREFPES
jgi:hypothetical protein